MQNYHSLWATLPFLPVGQGYQQYKTPRTNAKILWFTAQGGNQISKVLNANFDVLKYLINIWHLLLLIIF